MSIFLIIFPILLICCNYNPLGGSHSHIDDGNRPFLNTPGSFLIDGALVDDSKLYLSWTSAIKAEDYTVVYGTSPGNYSNTVANCSAFKKTLCTVSNLVNGTTYYFNVEARNLFGITKAKNEVTVTPSPFGLFVKPSSGSAFLSWADVAAGTGNTVYTVQYGTSPTTVSQILSTTNRSTLLTGLTDGQVYYFQVIASNISGTISSLIVSALVISPPAAPVWIGSPSVTASQITLNWNAAVGLGTIRYTVSRGTVQGGAYSDVPGCSNISVLTCVDSAATLIPGNIYYYVVMATNEGGDSPLSTEVSSITYPTFPTGLSLSAPNNASVSLNWSLAQGNANITYNIYRSTVTPVDVTNVANNIGTVNSTYLSPNISFTDSSSFSENTIYYYALTASNVSGTSGKSQDQNISSALLTAPSGLAASSVNTSSLTLSWNLSVGNAPLTFNVYRADISSPTNWGAAVFTGSANSYVDTGLLENKNYYYKVVAMNDRPNATQQQSTTFAVTTSLNTAPSFTAATNITVNSLTLNWSAVLGNGSVTYSLYRSTVNNPGSWGAPIYTGTTLSFADSGLSENRTYYYMVSATNSAPGATAQQSAIFSVATLLQTAATFSAATGVNVSSLTLNWSLSVGNAPVTFTLYRSVVNNPSNWGAPIYTGSATSFFDTGLLENKNYYYMVSVINNAPGAIAQQSSIFSVVTSLQTAPTFNVASSVTASSMTLSWNLSIGNASITYNLYRSTVNNPGSWGAAIYTGTATSFADSGLLENTNYYYMVSATNTAPGATAQQSAIYAVVTALQTAPTFIAATSITSNSLTVNWNLSVGNGSVIYSLYRSDINSPANWGSAIYIGTSTSFVDTGLLENKNYYYMVTAINNAPSAVAQQSSTYQVTTSLATAVILTNSAVSVNSASFQWTSAVGNGAVTYKLYRSTTLPVNIAGAAVCTNSPGNTCTDSGLNASTVYYYVVTVTNSQNTLKSSPAILVTTLPNTPNTPTTIATNGSVAISWAQSPSAGNATISYKVQRYRVPAGTVLDVSGCTNVSDSNRTCTDVVPTVDGFPYYYIVTAFTTGGNSPAASSPSIVTPISPITSVSITTTTSQITLSWAGALGVGAFNVYRSNTPAGSDPANGGTSTGCTSSPCTFSASAGQTFYYTIVASNTGTNSTASRKSSEYAAVVHASPISTVVAQTSQVFISWNSVVNATNYKIYYSATAGQAISDNVVGCDAGLGLSCTITGLTDGTPYYFAIVITKSVGGTFFGSEETATPIGAFSITSLVATGSTSGEITWSSAPGATGYDIKYGTSSGDYSEGSVTVSSSVTLPYAITGLSSGGLYYFMVTAKNASGSVDASAEEQLVMQVGTPTGLNVTSVTSTTTSLQWDIFSGNPSATYNIYRSTTLPFIASPVTPVCAVDSTSTPNNSCTDSGLLENTIYYYVISASNALGESQKSSPEVSTVTALQTSPTFGSATSVSKNSLTLNWSLSVGNAPITYNLYRSTVNNPGSWGSPIYTGSLTSFADNGLTENTNYYYMVSAKNNAPGAIERQSTIYATATALQTAPVFSAATNVTKNAMTLNWSLSVGNSTVTYRLYRSTVNNPGSWGAAIYTGTSLSFTDSGLTENTNYYYMVSATNPAIGATAQQSAIYAMATALQTAPVFSVATNVTKNAMTLNWSLNVGNSAVTYNVYRSTVNNPGSWGGAIYTGTSSSFADSGLTENTNYYYMVSATNTSIGATAQQSAIYTAVTALQTAPVFSAATNVTKNAMTLNWSLSVINSSVTYKLYRSTVNNPVNWGSPIFIGTALSYSDSGLSENTNYYYMVSATNTAISATEQQSSIYAAVTALQTAPVFSAATNVTNNAMTLNWSLSVVNSSVTYKLYRSTVNNPGSWGAAIYTGTSLTFADSGLTENTNYYYMVSATNTAISATEQQSSIYAVVTALQSAPTFSPATNITSTSLTLNWNAGVAGNGTVTYMLYRSPVDNPANWGSPIFTGTALSYSDSGLTENTNYYYMVSATNTAIGSTEQQSNSILVVTAISTVPTLTNISATTSVASFQWTSVAGNGSVTYKLYRSTSLPVNTGGAAICTNPAGNTCTDSSLNPSTIYYYVVTVSNAQNVLTSSTLSITTLPNTPTAPTITANDASVTITWAQSPSAGNATLTYLVKRSRLPGSGYQDVVGCTNKPDSNRTCTDIVPTVDGSSYYYTITAMTNGGNSPAASPQTTVTPITPITSINTSTTSTQITLSWSGAGGASGFQVYSSSSPNGSSPANGGTLTGCTSSPCVFTGTAGQTVYYTIVGNNSATNSTATTLSGEVSATPLASPLTQAIGQTAQVTLSWNAVANATNYKIYYSTTSGQAISGNQLGCDAGMSLTCVVTGLTNGQTYYFALLVTRSVGGDFQSSEVSATPIASFSIISVISGINTATVTWATATGATSYDISYGKVSSLYTTTVTVTAGGGASQASTVLSLIPGTQYFFMVKAKNASGSVNANAEVSTVTTPVPPANIAFSSVNYNSVTIEWDNNISNVPITYKVYRSTQSSFNITDASAIFACWNYETSTTPAQLSCVDNTSIVENTKYYYQIVAVTDAIGGNASQTSAASGILGVTTQFAPTNTMSLSVNNVTATTLTLTWTLNAGTENITYTVYKSNIANAASNGSAITCSPTINPSAPGATNTCNVTGLTQNQKYYFAIKATNNAPVGSATVISSDQIVVTQIASNTSFSISTSNITDTSVKLIWVFNAGTNAVNYTILQNGTAVLASQVSTCSLANITPSSTQVSCNVTGLAQNTAYTFAVRATNSATGGSTSVTSSNESVITQITTGTTFTVFATSVTDTSVILSWTFNFGTSSVNYTILQNSVAVSASQVSTCSLANMTPSSTQISCKVTGLNQNTNYTFAVRATNNATGGVTSALSGNTNVITQFTVSTSFTLTPSNVTDTSITLSWVFNFGDSAVSYIILQNSIAVSAGQVSTCSLTNITPSSTQISCNVTGLVQNKDYVFSVQASNNATGGATSVTSGNLNVTTQFTSGTTFSLTSSLVTDSSVTLSWVFNVGTSNVNYTILQNSVAVSASQITACSLTNITPSSTQISCNVTGLSQNTNYIFAVQASNGATGGSSTATSGNLNITTQFTSSTTFTLTSSSITSTSLTLNWTFNVGNSNVSFTILQDGSAVSAGQVSTCSLSSISPSSTPVTCNVTGLSANTNYSFTVQVTNSATGGSTTISSASLSVPTIPVSAPIGLSLSIPSTTAISASWNSYTIGNVNVTYNVYASTSSSVTINSANLFCSVSPSAVPRTSCSNNTVSGSALVVSTTYYFVIVASNSSGSSAASTPSESILFAAPSNSSLPTITGGPASGSGIVQTNGTILTGNLGTWSDMSNCTYQWYANSIAISGASGSITEGSPNVTYITQNSDTCKIISFSVTCSNVFGTVKKYNNSPNNSIGINTTAILNDYATRVGAVPGNTLSAAGQTQIKNYLDQLISNSIALPDAMYAMLANQNAGVGTSLYDVYCNQHNGIMAASPPTWDSTGGIISGANGIATISSLFSGNKSTIIAFARSPSVTASNRGVVGYTGSASNNSIGYGANTSSLIFQSLPSTTSTMSIPLSQNRFDFWGIAMNSAAVTFQHNEFQHTDTADSNKNGGLILGSFNGSAGTGLQDYMSFASAWASSTFSYSQLDSVRRIAQNTVVSGAQLFPSYMYVGNSQSTTVSTCAMQSNGTLSGCSTTSGFTTPIGVARYNNFLYIGNGSSNGVKQCTINTSTGALSGCASTGTGFPTSVYGVTISKGLSNVYLYASGISSVVKCTVNTSTGALSSCAATGGSFTSMQGNTFANLNAPYLYVTNRSGNSLSRCTLNSSSGAINTCTATGSAFTGPTNITIYNGYAYIPNASGNSVTKCTVNPSNGLLSSCAVATSNSVNPPSGGTYSSTEGVTVLNNYLYVANWGTSLIFKCSISSSDGSLSGCTATGSGFSGSIGMGF